MVATENSYHSLVLPEINVGVWAYARPLAKVVPDIKRRVIPVAVLEIDERNMTTCTTKWRLELLESRMKNTWAIFAPVDNNVICIDVIMTAY